jgi:hypothetical protein
MATTEGSLMTMPSPEMATSVFAVPRSMAMSYAEDLVKLSKMDIQ